MSSGGIFLLFLANFAQSLARKNGREKRAAKHFHLFTCEKRRVIAHTNAITFVIGCGVCFETRYTQKGFAVFTPYVA